MANRIHANENDRTLDLASEAEIGHDQQDPIRSSLRRSSYEEGMALVRPEDTLLGDLFRRIDQSGDKGLERSEVIAHLERVGIKAGLFGLVHSGIADKFMEGLDTDRDGQVTMAEFSAVANELLPAELFDAEGQMEVDKLEDFLKRVDTDVSGGISQKELEKCTLASLPEKTDYKGIVADAASKLGIDGLDIDGSGEIELEELQRAGAAVGAARAAGRR